MWIRRRECQHECRSVGPPPGTTGALNLYAPIQPYLGAIGIALLALALVIRLRGEISCATLGLWRSGVASSRSTQQAGAPLTTQDILAGLPSATSGAAGTTASEPFDPPAPA